MTTTSPTSAIGRPRDPDVDASILRAAQDLLIDRGYAGMTMEGVARAAGTGKAAVYRRYASRSALVVAAVRALHGPAEPPDTGSLREDLRECALHYTRGDARMVGLMAGLLTAAGEDHELREVTTAAIGAPRAAAFRTVIQRWIDAGTVPSDVPVETIVSIVPSVAFGRVVISRALLDVQTVDELVDRVLLPALGVVRADDVSRPATPSPR